MVMTLSTTSTSICSMRRTTWRASVAPGSVRSSPKPDNESSEHFRRLSDRVDALQIMSLTTNNTLGEAVQAEARCSASDKQLERQRDELKCEVACAAPVAPSADVAELLSSNTRTILGAVESLNSNVILRRRPASRLLTLDALRWLVPPFFLAACPPTRRRAVFTQDARKETIAVSYIRMWNALPIRPTPKQQVKMTPRSSPSLSCPAVQDAASSRGMDAPPTVPCWRHRLPLTSLSG